MGLSETLGFDLTPTLSRPWWASFAALICLLVVAGEPSVGVWVRLSSFGER